MSIWVARTRHSHWAARQEFHDVQADGAKDDNHGMKSEDVGNAEGKAQDHGQNAEPVEKDDMLASSVIVLV